MKKVFVAGATGAVGKTILQLAQNSIEIVAHVRPQSEAKIEHLNRVAIDLSSEQLSEKMLGCDSVMQLIGTMRNRFSKGDTYESSDIQTTKYLLAAAKKAKVPHFILLSSVGADKPFGAYLKAKAQAEQLVRESGLSFTIFRPSAFKDREGVSGGFLLEILPKIGLRNYRPITLNQLACALLFSGHSAGPSNAILQGDLLFQAVAQGAQMMVK